MKCAHVHLGIIFSVGSVDRYINRNFFHCLVIIWMCSFYYYKELQVILSYIKLIKFLNDFSHRL